MKRWIPWPVRSRPSWMSSMPLPNGSIAPCLYQMIPSTIHNGASLKMRGVPEFRMPGIRNEARHPSSSPRLIPAFRLIMISIQPVSHPVTILSVIPILPMTATAGTRIQAIREMPLRPGSADRTLHPRTVPGTGYGLPESWFQQRIIMPVSPVSIIDRGC